MWKELQIYKHAFNQSKYECNKKKNNKKLHEHSEFVVWLLNTDQQETKTNILKLLKLKMKT